MPQRNISSLDELKSLIGQEAAIGEWFEITQDRIDAFAAVTLDRQWIHIDPDRARKESPYGTTIAHGFLTLSLLSHLLSAAVRIDAGFTRGINYGINRLRFPSAVTCGSRVRGRFVLQSVKDVEGGVEIVWAITVEVEGREKPALVVEWVLRQYR
jgi:acyl dehydratase